MSNVVSGRQLRAARIFAGLTQAPFAKAERAIAGSQWRRSRGVQVGIICGKGRIMTLRANMREQMAAWVKCAAC